MKEEGCTRELRLHLRPFFEAEILLVCARNRDLWPPPKPKVRDSRTHCQIWQIWLAEKHRTSTLCMLRNWERPEVSIPGADQKDRGLWAGDENARGSHWTPLRILNLPFVHNHNSLRLWSYRRPQFLAFHKKSDGRPHKVILCRLGSCLARSLQAHWLRQQKESILTELSSWIVLWMGDRWYEKFCCLEGTFIWNEEQNQKISIFATQEIVPLKLY